MNHVYPESNYKPAYNDNNQMQIDSKDQDDNSPYLCSFLINLVRQLANKKGEHDIKILRNGILALIQFGARLDITDNDGRDAMTYAVMSNNVQLVDLFINNKQVGHLNTKI